MKSIKDKSIFFITIFVLILIVFVSSQGPCSNERTFCVNTVEELRSAIRDITTNNVTIFMRGGTYEIEHLQVNSTFGTHFGEISIESFPGEHVIIQDEQCTVLPMFNFQASHYRLHKGLGELHIRFTANCFAHELIFISQNLENIIIGPLTLIDTFPKSAKPLITVESNVDGIHFEGVIVHDLTTIFGARDIINLNNIGTSPSSYPSGYTPLPNALVVIRNCRFENVQEKAISINGDAINVLIISNSFNIRHEDRTASSVGHIVFMSNSVSFIDIHIVNNIFANQHLSYGRGHISFSLLSDNLYENIKIFNNLFLCSNYSRNIFFFYGESEILSINAFDIRNNIFKGGCGLYSGHVVDNSNPQSFSTILKFTYNVFDVNRTEDFIFNEAEGSQVNNNLFVDNVPILGDYLPTTSFPYPFALTLQRYESDINNQGSYPTHDFINVARGMVKYSGPFEEQHTCIENMDPLTACTTCLNGNEVRLDENLECTVVKCYNIWGDQNDVCNTHGSCINTNVCNCHDMGIYKYEGFECDIVGLTWLFYVLIFSIPFVLFIIVIIVAIIILIIVLLKWGERIKIERDNEIKNATTTVIELEGSNSSVNISFNIPKTLQRIERSQLKMENLIGSGGSCQVFSAKWNSARTVAVKKFSFVFNEETKFEEAEKEIKIMSELSHPGIIQIFGVLIEKNAISVVMQYCSNGSLKDFVKKRKGKLKMKHKMQMISEIVDVFEYLHGRTPAIIHRDLKGDNILLDDNLHCKIGDFGLSKAFISQGSITKAIGTPYYMSPELTRGEKYNETVDVFAFGVLLYEIIGEDFENPYGVTKSERDFIQFKVASNPEFRPEVGKLKRFRFPSYFTEIMKKCWSTKPNERPSFALINQILMKNKKSLIVYLKKKETKESEAMDSELKVISMNGILLAFKSMIKKHGWQISFEGNEKFYIFNNKELIELKTDWDVITMVKQNSVITYSQ